VGFRLIELLKDVGQRLGGNAFPRVGHLHAEVVGFSNQRHRDPLIGGRVFEGVSDQVGQHLVDPLSVEGNGRKIRALHHRFETEFLGSASQGTMRASTPAKMSVMTIGNFFHAQFPRFNAHDVHEVADQPGQMVGLGNDDP
jgi:hypothetical protein